jgi:hypothetical protein
MMNEALLTGVMLDPDTIRRIERELGAHWLTATREVKRRKEAGLILNDQSELDLWDELAGLVEREKKSRGLDGDVTTEDLLIARAVWRARGLYPKKRAAAVDRGRRPDDPSPPRRGTPRRASV